MNQMEKELSREIKFRAWDKTKNVFIPTDCWAICQTDFKAFGIMIKDWENYREGEYFYSNTQELSQFTGLKDKDGVEIYEGDQLHICAGYSSVVEFKDAMFVSVYSHPEDGEIIPLLDVVGKNTIVIGNIYENK